MKNLNLLKGLLACFILTWTFLTCPKADAQALPEAPRPQTGGEWAQAGLPFSDISGINAIQPFLDTIDLKSKLELNLIEADIVEHIQNGNPYQFSDIMVENPITRQVIDVSHYKGTTLSLEDLNNIAEQLQKPCTDKGILCQIKMSLEVDTNQNNVLSISQKPFVINGVNITGNRYFRRSTTKYLLGIKPDKVLNVKTLEKRLRLLQDNPDLTIQGTLEPVELNDDKVDINLTVEDHLPVHFSSFWNNIDLSYYGQQMTGTNVTINNLTGLNDSVSATAITDAKVHGVFTHYEIPINSHGTRVGFDYSFLKATPNGKDYTPFKIRGDVWSISPGIYQTLIARKNLRLSTDLNFDSRQVRTSAYRNITIEREQIRDLRLGIDLSEAGESHEFSTRQEFTVGLPILGATKNDSELLSNTGGGSQFFRYIGTFYLSKELPLSMAAVLNGTFQWSPWTLPSTDVGGLGGTYAGRGYTEGVFQADSFVFTSAELHFPAFMIPKSLKIPKSEISLRDSTRFLTFVDYGSAFINDDHRINNNESQQILSVGVGTRIEFSKYLSGRCDLAVPLIRHEATPFHARVHFGLQANVL